MDGSIIRPALIILGVIALLLNAARLNLYSQNGVRHMHRYYHGLLMQTFFYVLFLTKIGDNLYAKAPIVIPIGCVAGCVFYVLSRRWFNRHFDGESLLIEPLTVQYVVMVAFLLLAPFIFSAFKSYLYAAIGAAMIAWTLSSVLFMAYLWKLQKKLGHPIFEREALPPTAVH